MSRVKRLAVIAVAVPAAALLASCGSSSLPAIVPSERIVPVPGSSAGQIVLSAVGAQRIGIQTAVTRPVPALSAPPAPPPTTKLVHRATGIVKVTVPAPKPKPIPSSSKAIVPVAAVVYDPGGSTYVFTSPGALKYTEVPITVDHITGNSVYLRTGPRPGTAVVTVGAEELFGVQTGVLAQT
jgi:hypothetical protein